MMSSRKRHLQYLAAQRFYEEATGDFAFYQEDPSLFTEAELREEAAFRCWLREIDADNCPLMRFRRAQHCAAWQMHGTGCTGL